MSTAAETIIAIAVVVIAIMLYRITLQLEAIEERLRHDDGDDEDFVPASEPADV